MPGGRIGYTAIVGMEVVFLGTAAIDGRLLRLVKQRGQTTKEEGIPGA